MSADKRQFPLDLPHEPAYEAADFIASACNQAARQLIETWREWPNGAAAIWGPPGAGKTHLAHVWADAAGAAALGVEEFRALDLGDVAAGSRFVLDLNDSGLAEPDERTLFHLLNITREGRGGLLLVAREAPARWPTALPDLASRLRAAPAAAVGAPDDGLFAAVLAKLFADRQLVIDRQTIDYLTARSERSFAAARELVARIDSAALARRRKINVRLAGEVLGEIENS